MIVSDRPEARHCPCGQVQNFSIACSSFSHFSFLRRMEWSDRMCGSVFFSGEHCETPRRSRPTDSPQQKAQQQRGRQQGHRRFQQRRQRRKQQSKCFQGLSKSPQASLWPHILLPLISHHQEQSLRSCVEVPRHPRRPQRQAGAAARGGPPSGGGRLFSQCEGRLLEVPTEGRERNHRPGGDRGAPGCHGHQHLQGGGSGWPKKLT